MIDTIIFDIGNVLAEWHWKRTFAEWFGAEKAADVAAATVRHAAWREMDRGVLSEDELCTLLQKNDVRYPREIERVVRENHKLVTVFPYADGWLRGLRAAGYRVYILSNFGDLSYNRAKKDFTFLEFADGALISYEVKCLKPDREIFEALCTRFSIVPENAVFLDDVAENVAGAEAYGLKGITVESFEQADAALSALGVQYTRDGGQKT